MSLTDQLQPLFERLPDDKRTARRAFWDQLVTEGFPGTKHERWRFTDIAGAVAEPPTPPGSAQLELPRFEGLRLVGFINGHSQHLDDREHRESPARSVSEPSDLVNASLATSGLIWQPDREDTALHLCTRSLEGSVHLRHRIHVRSGVSAVLYWDDLVTEDAGFGTQTLEIQVDENARLDVARSHRNTAGGPQLLRTEAVLASAASLHMTGFDAGSGLSRHDLRVTLTAQGAEVTLNGVYAPFAKGHIDTFASVDHASQQTVSRMQFRGIGMEKSAGLLTGRVHVHRDAQQADSDQQLSALLLSPKARINAKPELEIYADDVVCAHGNAIGQIDEEALHYLQTRGIDRVSARALLISGFAAETLAFAANDAVHADLLKALESALQHADWSAT